MCDGDGDDDDDAGMDDEWGRRVLAALPHMDKGVVQQIVQHSENNEPLGAQELQALVAIMGRAPHMCSAPDRVLGDVIDLLNWTLGCRDGHDADTQALIKPCVQTLFHADPGRFRASYDARLQMHADGPEAWEWADRFWDIMELPLPRK